MAGKDFGFEVGTARQMDLDAVDPVFSDDIAASVPGWRACLQCGSCSATCPAGLNLRQMHHRLTCLTGLPSETEIKGINTCFLCGKCQLVCPGGIPTRYLSLIIRQKISEYAQPVASV